MSVVRRTVRVRDAGANGRKYITGGSLDPDGEYSVATNAFVVNYDSEPITPDRVVGTWDGGVQYDAILEYAREQGLDVEFDGRLSAAATEASGTGLDD